MPDRATFDRLLELRALDGFALREAALEHVTDHYLDTPTRAIERVAASAPSHSPPL